MKDYADTINKGGLLLLGCGKMGSAMLRGWLEAGVRADAVTVIDPHPSEFARSLADSGLTLNPDAPRQPRVCVIAVKPQMMSAAAPQLAAFSGGGTLFVSVAAGTMMATLEALLGPGTPLVRCMPNTPAAVGRGITALTGNETASAADLDLTDALLQAVGQTVRLDDEGQMDAVTAVSGSGPAYVFYLIETLAAAGEAEGLPADVAMRLATATVAGAGHLAETAVEEPSELRAHVTSPGGTTAAGLEALIDAETGLAPLMRETVARAAARGRELAKGD